MAALVAVIGTTDDGAVLDVRLLPASDEKVGCAATGTGAIESFVARVLPRMVASTITTATVAAGQMVRFFTLPMRTGGGGARDEFWWFSVFCPTGAV